MKRLVLPLHLWMLASHLTVLGLPLFALVGTGALALDLRRQTQEDLQHQGALLALHIEAELASRRTDDVSDVSGLPALLGAARAATLAGFRVVDEDGVVVASSTGENVGEDLSGAAEVRAALGGTLGLSVKPRGPTDARSGSLSGPSRHADERVFVATPVRSGEGVVGAVLLSRTPREEVQTFYQMGAPLALGVLFAFLGTLLLAIYAGHLLSRSLRSLAGVSLKLAAGTTDTGLDLLPALSSHVAETRMLADAMTTMYGRLQERLRYISEFAGNVSHEFKTPVSALRGTVELLRDDADMPAAQRSRFLDNALSDLDRLSRLVGGLLRLARAEEGGGRERLDLGELCREVAGRHPGVVVLADGPADVSGNVSGNVSADVSDVSREVFGNREQLSACVENLLDNAERHGKTTPRVRLWGDPAMVGVTVEDDGPGISPASLPHIFDRFYTTNRSGGGTGLGLALVRAVVTAHGGRVEVESAPGKTTFRVGLPRVG